jgi:two-component system, NarL family, response regulator LiaR
MPGTARRPLRVLIADDQRLFAESLMMALGVDERVDVVGVAADGEKAVQLSGDLEPDIVLMDVMMPVLDGIEATRRIRSTAHAPSVIVMTGTEGETGYEDAIDAGASAFVHKSMTIESLMTVFFEIGSLVSLLQIGTGV